MGQINQKRLYTFLHSISSYRPIISISEPFNTNNMLVITSFSRSTSHLLLLHMSTYTRIAMTMVLVRYAENCSIRAHFVRTQGVLYFFAHGDWILITGHQTAPHFQHIINKYHWLGEMYAAQLELASQLRTTGPGSFTPHHLRIAHVQSTLTLEPIRNTTVRYKRTLLKTNQIQTVFHPHSLRLFAAVLTSSLFTFYDLCPTNFP